MKLVIIQSSSSNRSEYSKIFPLAQSSSMQPQNKGPGVVWDGFRPSALVGFELAILKVLRLFNLNELFMRGMISEVHQDLSALVAQQLQVAFPT